jgi:hypothetical protein
LLRGLLAYAVIGSVIWIQRSGDFAGYLLVGNLVRAGRDIYLDATANTWPPSFSLLCVPLALLATPTPYLARGCWLLLNFACLLLVFRIIAQLVYRRDLSLRAESTGLSLAAPELLVPYLLTDRYVSGNFDHLQINIIIFALALGGLSLQATGREVAGGIALGCAAALKVMPVIFIPYLGYRRRWRAAAYSALAWAVFTLCPIVVFGWSRFWEYAAGWHAKVVAGWDVGQMNQSVVAMWARLIADGMARFGTAGINDRPELGATLLMVAVAASLAVVTLSALWIFRGAARPDGWTALAEWSVVFIVGAIFGPVCWKAYLVVLLLPNTLLFAVWRSPQVDARTRRTTGAILVVAYLIGAFPSPGFVGETVASFLERASGVTVAALILLAGTLWLHTPVASISDSASELNAESTRVAGR